MKYRLVYVLAATLTLTGFRGADDPAILSPGDMIGYLTQARCPDGQPPTKCTNPVPQRAEDQAHWRKHDYSTITVGREDGYMAQDGALSRDGTIVNTWGFWPPWKAFDPWIGDGGEVYRVEAGWAKVLMTRDGGKHHDQYFCGGTGWLLFDNQPPTGSWKATLAWLNISRDQVSCPSPLNQSFTRWRMEYLTVPFNIFGKKHEIALSCIISEHYNGPTIAAAVDMEQAIWCKDWGRIWAAAYSPRGEGWLVFGYRLPGIPWGGGVVPERPDFKMSDARLSTNIQPNPKTRQIDFGWPPAGYKP